MKRYVLSALSLLLAVSLLVLPASAAVLDPDRTGSITATMTYDGEPIPGGTLTLYHVADLNTNTLEFHYTEDYAGCDVVLDKETIESPSTASELAAYTVTNNISGETKVINARGVVKFDDLTPGLYLLIQWKAAEGFYEILPFLVSIPNNIDGEYVYDVDCLPKQEVYPEPTCPSFPTCPSEPEEPTTCPTVPEPPTTVPSVPTEPSVPSVPTEPEQPSEPTTTEPEQPTTEPQQPTTEPEPPTTEPAPTEEPTEPSEPKLPQTGQNNWPIPVLAMGGIVLVVLGAIVLTADRKKTDEA